MKLLKFGLLIFGIYILFSMIHSVGLTVLADKLSSLKWQLLPVLCVYPFIFAFDTLGWKFSFPKSLPKHIPFHDLYMIRIIGETLNCVIPWAASLGGEPIKADLLKRRHGVPLADGYASILIVHTTFWVSLNIFVIGAIVVTLKTLPLTPVLWRSVLAFLVGLGIAAVLLIIGLHFGVFKYIHSVGDFFKWWGEKSQERKLKFLELDDQIKRFYTRSPRRFVASVFFNFLGWFAGAFEVFFIAQVLGIEIGFYEAWLLEALIQVLRIVTFFIPSSIGAQEGGIVLIFLQFGFDKTLGLTFALIRRIREIIWIALGLLIWSLLEDRPRLRDSVQQS